MNINRAINMIFARPLFAFALAALLIAAACLSVAAPALAQEWGTTCKTDEWDDSIVCTAKSPGARASRSFYTPLPAHVASRAVYQCARKADGTKEGFYQLEFRDVSGISLDSDDAETDSEGRIFYNVPMRWDDEPPVKSAFFWRKESDSIASLVWKNQSQAARQFRARDKLRIRPSMGGKLPPKPTTFTYSLLGAAEAVAEAAGKCGF